MTIFYHLLKIKYKFHFVENRSLMIATEKKILLPKNIPDQWFNNQLVTDHLTDQYQKKYQYIKRSAKPKVFVVHDKAVIKLYHMERETEPLPENLVSTVKSFIYQEIENNNIEPTQGVGFAILSQGFLSINLWGRGNVLFTSTYTVEENFPELSRTPLEKTGVACTWEIRIMNYEYGLWHHYLETQMSLDNKKKYLQSFISGKLYE